MNLLGALELSICCASFAFAADAADTVAAAAAAAAAAVEQQQQLLLLLLLPAVNTFLGAIYCASNLPAGERH
jgi:hypothetical protein